MELIQNNMSLVATLYGLQHSNNRIHFPRFCKPADLVILTCQALKDNVGLDGIHFQDDDSKSYVKNLGFEDILNGINVNRHDQPLAGETYSPLVSIQDENDVELASGTISKCVDKTLDQVNIDFRKQLCHVIGELHDNVYSHSTGHGISVAQCYRNKEFHFALADTGIGFLKEMKRTGKECCSHEEAVKWCVKEGNSTKIREYDDGWSQRVPEDMIGNPFAGVVSTYHNENNHQGLGLHKLVNLVKEYKGNLQLVSGDCHLSITAGSNPVYVKVPNWGGVAISCIFDKFDASKYTQGSSNEDQINKIIGDLR